MSVGHTKLARRARVAVREAIKAGRLTRPSQCEKCKGTPKHPAKVHGHHDDYTKPLKVRWLCASCHRQHHWNNGDHRPRPSHIVKVGERAALYGLSLCGLSLGTIALILGRAPLSLRGHLNDDWVTTRRTSLARKPPRVRASVAAAKARHAAIIALFQSGRYTLQAVANEFGITRERVRQILRRAGISERVGAGLDPAVHRERVARYLAALKPGVSTREACASVGLAYIDVVNSARAVGETLPKTVRAARIRYAEIAAFYLANPNLCGVDVAKQFNCPPMRVTHALRAMGIQPRQSGWSRGDRSADASVKQAA